MTSCFAGDCWGPNMFNINTFWIINGTAVCIVTRAGLHGSTKGCCLSRLPSTPTADPEIGLSTPFLELSHSLRCILREEERVERWYDGGAMSEDAGVWAPVNEAWHTAGKYKPRMGAEHLLPHPSVLLWCPTVNRLKFKSMKGTSTLIWQRSEFGAVVYVLIKRKLWPG